MPGVRVWPGSADRPIYQVGGKSFVFFRNPRPDAVDPETGERYDDVIVFWVASEADKLALVQDPRRRSSPPPTSTGTRRSWSAASRLGEVSREELAEIVEDAWLSRASPTRAVPGCGNEGDPETPDVPDAR